MPVKVFYAWQSDRPSNLNKNLVRRALDEAAKALGKDMSVEEAFREVVVDQDTQDVPGTPSVTDTILEKIRNADVFVADLTYIDDMEDGKRTPNPNVMLEYGYALHALGDSKILSVFNEGFGKPEHLPFDIRHKRWPIRFNVTDGSDTEEGKESRRKQRTALTNNLRDAFKAIFSQFADDIKEELPGQQAYVPVDPVDGKGSFHKDGNTLCIRPGLLNTDAGRNIRMRVGPYMYLRIIPTVAKRPLRHVEAQEIARGNIQPIGGMRSGGWSTGRNENGSVVFLTMNDNQEVAWEATQLFLSREIWAIDHYFLSNETNGDFNQKPVNYVPTGAVEEVLIDSLINYLDVAKTKLEIELPVIVEAGLVGVKDYTLAVDTNFFHSRFAGNVMNDHIKYRFNVETWDVDPFDALKPFFEDIYDAAGENRPNTRTSGKKQR
ncbi:hypothetical protein [Azospirillum sp. TSA6c]|uniref:hypothetical protein n=1 Tax=Azospirillum sp. TSA6c TaxID=709813 RepID=UPI0011B84D02|nr:hypothetical protein [Azospirillum sp. TSA6c]